MKIVDILGLLAETYRRHRLRSTARILAWQAVQVLAHMGMVKATWEPWLNDLVRWEGRTFVDIGANIGQWTKVLARGYERIIAIEPHPWAAEVLRKSYLPNVQVLECALWDGMGRMPLMVYYNWVQWSSLIGLNGIRDGRRPHHSIMVCTTTLDALNLKNVDFIKVDVEGAECEVINGAWDTINRERPELLIEIHSKEKALWCIGNLGALGYACRIKRAPFYSHKDPYYDSHVWIKADP